MNFFQILKQILIQQPLHNGAVIALNISDFLWPKIEIHDW